MELGEKDVMYLSLPPNFQTAETRALGYAADNMMKKLMSVVRHVSVWSDMKNIPDKYLDHVAASIRAPYYASEDDAATKRQVIDDAFKTYMFAGTKTAVEKLIDTVFEDSVFVPWYEYDGIPFHFRIAVNTEPTEEMLVMFLETLKRVKAARSVLDGIENKVFSIDLSAYASTGEWSYSRLEEQSD